MRYGVDPPWYDGPVERLAFNAYAMRKTGLEEIINSLVESDDPNDIENQAIAFGKGHDYNIFGMEDLTSDEIDYIQTEVAKRWVG